MIVEDVDGCYCPNKMQFSRNSGPLKSVRCVLEAFKLYFDDSTMDILVAERNQYNVKFINTHKDEPRPQFFVLSWKENGDNFMCFATLM